MRISILFFILNCICIISFSQDSVNIKNSKQLKGYVNFDGNNLTYKGDNINKFNGNHKHGLWVNYQLDTSVGIISILNVRDTCITIFNIDTVGILKDKLFCILDFGKYNNDRKIGEWFVFNTENGNLKFRIFYDNNGFVKKIMRFSDNEDFNGELILIYIARRDALSNKFILEWMSQAISEEDMQSIFNFK